MDYKIDKDKCIGCGTCAALFEKAIKLGEDGKATIINQEEIKGEDGLIDVCPVQAIEKISKGEN